MVDEKKKSPTKGDFIDLEKTEFKKKRNILSFLAKYVSLGLVFFGMGLFISKKYQIPIDFGLENNAKQKANVDILSDLKSDVVILEDDIENISERIKKSDLFYENLENKNSELLLKLDEVTERVKEVGEFDYTSSFKKELNQYELLKNLLILKNKFSRRNSIENEMSIISTFFENDYEVLTLLNFFSEVDLSSVVQKNYLLNEVNEKIRKYDLKLDDFFRNTKIENDLKETKIFESKDKFLNYLNDLFDSTFKITKYEDANFDENILENGNYRDILVSAKEHLLVDNLDQAIRIIEQSGIDLDEHSDWLEKSKKLNEVEKNIKNLEDIILQNLVSQNDKSF